MNQKFMGLALEGFTTVIILVLFTSSIMMISLGIIGYYFAKMYNEIKGRPKFIIMDTTCEELFHSLKNMIMKGMVLNWLQVKNPYRDQIEKTFPYNDLNNCKRMYEE